MVGHGLAQGQVSRQALTSPRGRLGPLPVFGVYRFICLMKRAFVTATLLVAFIVRVAHPAPAQAMAGLRAVTCCARAATTPARSRTPGGPKIRPRGRADGLQRPAR